MEKETRKITKTTSGSYTVVIPKEIIEKYHWREKQKVVVEDKGRGLIQIRDWRRK